MRTRKATMAPMKMFIYIIYSFMILIAVTTFATTLIRATGSINLLSEDTEKEIIHPRAIYSTDCFAYTDATGRAYDRIDLSRFDDEILEHCMDLRSYRYEMRFVLEHTGSEKTYNASTADWYGSYSYESFSIPVLVQDSEEMFPGRLVVEYQTSPRKR